MANKPLLDITKIKITKGMPDHNHPINKSWQSESLTAANLEMPKDAGFFDLFQQDPNYSYHMEYDGKIIAVSGTTEWSDYIKRATEVGKKLLEEKTVSTGCKKIVELNMKSLDNFKNMLTDKTYGKVPLILHNSGLLVDEAYRGHAVNYRDSAMSVGEFMILRKIEELIKAHGVFVLFTNANNAGSSRIFNKYMERVASADYSKVGLNHGGSFDSFAMIFDK